LKSKQAKGTAPVVFWCLLSKFNGICVHACVPLREKKGIPVVEKKKNEVWRDVVLVETHNSGTRYHVAFFFWKGRGGGEEGIGAQEEVYDEVTRIESHLQNTQPRPWSTHRHV
jgi:hypothetical protein